MRAFSRGRTIAHTGMRLEGSETPEQVRSAKNGP